jgi:hypothetical protein
MSMMKPHIKPCANKQLLTLLQIGARNLIAVNRVVVAATNGQSEGLFVLGLACK